MSGNSKPSQSLWEFTWSGWQSWLPLRHQLVLRAMLVSEGWLLQCLSLAWEQEESRPTWLPCAPSNTRMQSPFWRRSNQGSVWLLILNWPCSDFSCGSTGSSMLAHFPPWLQSMLRQSTLSGLHIWSHWCKLGWNHISLHQLTYSSAIILSAIVFLSGQKRYVKVPPQGSAIIDACKVLNIVRQEKHFEDAKPSALEASGRLSKYPFASSPRYTDQYVTDVRRGFRSCRVSRSSILSHWFILTHIIDVHILSILFCLLGSDLEQSYLTGRRNGVTRNAKRSPAKPRPDRLVYFYPTSWLWVLIWWYQRKHMLTNVSPVGVYPVLRKFKINFSPVRRIFAGFLLVSISMIYSSVLQHYIYTSPAKSIHVWIQAPAYIFVAFSEAFVIVTGLELAFTHAPKK